MAITVNVIQFGKTNELEVPEGATYEDLQNLIPNGKNLDVRAGGEPIAKKFGQKVTPGERLTAAPRQVKQGL